jgi:hypothetical protein
MDLHMITNLLSTNIWIWLWLHIAHIYFPMEILNILKVLKTKKSRRVINVSAKDALDDKLKDLNLVQMTTFLTF